MVTVNVISRLTRLLSNDTKILADILSVDFTGAR